METVADVFRKKEHAQALCPDTKIWWPCQIAAIEGSWSVRVEFTNWSGKHRITKIVVPKNQPRDKWVIRKPVKKHDDVSRKQALKNKCTDSQLGYTVDKRKQYDVVHFVHDESDPTDVSGTLEQSIGIQKGWVFVNDPFLKQMYVWVKCDNDQTDAPDQDSAVTIVKYSDLRPSSDFSYVKEEHTSPKPTKRIPVVEPVPKKTKTITTAKKRPITDVIAELPVTELSVVPCLNGILEIGSVVEQFNQTFVVEKIFFDTEKSIAMAEIHHQTDILISITLPAVYLKLNVPDFHKDRKLKVDWSIDNMNIAFVLFAAIKRAIAISVKKGDTWHQRELCRSTTLVCNILGFKSQTQKRSVMYSSKPLENELPMDHWDRHLGEKWDLMEGKDGHADYVIRQMKFAQTNLYVGDGSIRILLQGVSGYFANQNDYRSIVGESMRSHTYQCTLEMNQAPQSALIEDDNCSDMEALFDF